MSEFQNTRFAILRKQKEEQFGFRVQPARGNDKILFSIMFNMFLFSFDF